MHVSPMMKVGHRHDTPMMKVAMWQHGCGDMWPCGGTVASVCVDSGVAVTGWYRSVLRRSSRLHRVPCPRPAALCCVQPPDVGSLLTNAGFSMPTGSYAAIWVPAGAWLGACGSHGRVACVPAVDTHTITVNFSDAIQLMEELQVWARCGGVSVHVRAGVIRSLTAPSWLLLCLRIVRWAGQGMGENGALLHGKWATRDTMLAMAAAYQAMYGNADGTVPATFEVRGGGRCCRGAGRGVVW